MKALLFLRMGFVVGSFWLLPGLDVVEVLAGVVVMTVPGELTRSALFKLADFPWVPADPGSLTMMAWWR